MRSIRIFIIAILAVGVLSTVAAAAAQSDEDPVIVIEVDDPLDQQEMDYVVDSLRTPDVHVFVVKINSPGISSGDPTEMYTAVAEAGAPVIAWIGPNPSVAFGGAAFLANNADIRSAAPGTSVGFLEPAVQRSGQGPTVVRPGPDPDLWIETQASLADTTRKVSVEQPSIYGFVDRIDPALGQLIVSLDGVTVARDSGETFTMSTAKTEIINEQEFVVASRPVVFVKTGLLDRFLRLGARPETAFLFLVVGLAFAAFEFYAAGSGLMAGVAGLSFIPAAYGLATLPIWWPAVVSIVVGFGFLVWGFVQNRVDWRAVLGTIAVIFGGFTFTSSRPAYPPVAWLVIVATATSVVFVWYTLTTVVRARFATPTVGRENLLGRRCVVVDGLDPIGVVLLDDARWRATADRGVTVTAGAPVEIVGITGLLLEVDPIGSQTGSLEG